MFQSTDEYKDACQLWILYEESLSKAPEEVKEKQKQKQLMEEDEKFSNRRVITNLKYFFLAFC